MCIRRIILTGLLFAATLGSAAELVQAFSSESGTQPPAPWRVQGLPGSKSKPLSHFDLVQIDGKRVLRVIADKSYGTLRHDLPGLLIGASASLRWRWRLDQPLRLADLRRRAGDDSPLKVCALFDLQADKLGLIDRSLLLAMRRFTGQNLPAATLCYVWDHQLPVGTELPNAFTARVRYLVLNSGEAQLASWVPHERDLAADFLRAFGDETDRVPPLIGLLIGADADNTGGTSLAYVGDLVLTVAPQAAKP